MTTKEFQTRGTLSIFFHYFKAHRRLFALDMTCAFLMSLVDLAFPYVSRTCMYDLLPNNLYGTFFAVMGIMLAAYIIRAGLQYTRVLLGPHLRHPGGGGHPPGSLHPHPDPLLRVL